MKVSLKWLREYVDLTLSPADLARRLTLAGAEVDDIETVGGDWEGVVVAKVVNVGPHPNADRLRLATVDLGGETMTVVCGAPNVAPGQKVAFAKAGVRIIDGRTGQPAVLRPATIRGVESAGMVLSEKELGISDEHTGILVLPQEAPVGTPLSQYLGDVILDIDVTPNRPDLLSVLGVAREAAALTGVSVREPSLDYPEAGPPIQERVSVAIADPNFCLRYCAAFIEDVKIGPSPAWMQQRLTAAGMRPINNVVDITNYVMLELGQPLHAFDFRLLEGGQIIVRRARPGEHIVTIDGSSQTLDQDMLVIADAKAPVAVAGVMGGAASEVSDTTTTILLESANFLGANIRRTSAALKMRTESSLRFEKGLSPELAMIAAKRAIRLMVEIAGGRAARGIIDVYPGQRPLQPITLTRQRIRKVLGIDLEPEQVIEVLGFLGCGVQQASDGRYAVTIPYWRTDISIADDVIEELARIISYDELPTTTLRGAIPPAQPQPLRQVREQVRDILADAGMQEIINYPLTSLEALGKVLPAESLAETPPLRIANPMSREQQYLRLTLRASLLETLARNRRHRTDRLALFEVNRVYLPRPDDLPQEVEMVVGVVAGAEPPQWWQASGPIADFYDAKGYVEFLLDELGLTAQFQPAEDYSLLPGRTAQVIVNGQAVGMVGQVHPRVAAAFDLDEEAFLFEVNIEALVPHVGGPQRYEPILRYPAVVEDLAIVVDEALPAARVRDAIAAEPLVRSVTIFDVYRGDPIPPGKMSLTFRITYQAMDHTLTDDEVAQARGRIVQRLQRELGATLRG